MNKKVFLFVALLTINNFIFSQNNYSDYWQDLLKNNRVEAKDKFLKTHKKHDKNIVDLLSHEIIRNENGYINGASKGFLDKLISFKDFEYYVYALWNKQFFFDNYLETGFHKNNSNQIEKVSKQSIYNPTIKYSLSYLNAIRNRSYKDYDTYKNIVSKIPTIKKWQFCGTFENMNGSGIDVVYEPESYVNDDKLFNANSNGFIGWYTPNTTYQTEAYQFFTNHSEYGAGVNYAQTFVKSSKDQRVQLRIANSSVFKVWLNDALVYKNENDVNTDLDAYIVNVNLSEGNNRILIKNAERDSYSYFALRISDEQGKPVEGLEYTEKVQAYNKKNVEEVNPIEVKHSIEQFFIDRVSEKPNEFLYKYCLINTYLRNQKFKEAKEVLKPLQEEFKNSSLLRVLEVLTSTHEKDYVKLKEVSSNIINDDPKYFFSLLVKIADSQRLSRMDMPTFEAFLNDVKTAMPDYDMISDMADMMLHSKNQDLNELRNIAERMMNNHKDKLYLMKRIIPLYNQLYKNKDLVIKKTEDILIERFSTALEITLMSFYETNGQKNKALKLLEEGVKTQPEDNYYISRIVQKLHADEKYKKSLPYIEEMLKNYPYSFKAMEYKGDALSQLNKKAEAIKLYEKSLTHNSGNSNLRKTIQNLKKEKSLIDRYKEEDLYDFIGENRNKYKVNNHGTNILLDESVIQLFENGSLKRRSALAYEITSKKGIESYKEYDLGLSGNYQIIKAEIVKADKTVKPAEKNRSQFVFNGLEIGDVILIEYETNSTGSGRFYKDFVDFYQFDSESFCHKTNYTLIVPKSFNF